MARSESVTTVTHGETTFVLVGTAHVSARSVAEVEQVIAEVAPAVVGVELCQRRLDALRRGDGHATLDVAKAIRDGRALATLAQLALGAYQRALGDRLGVRPGAELLAATRAAAARGATLALLDRSLDITLARTWRSLSSADRLRLLRSLVLGEPAAADGASAAAAAAAVASAATPEELAASVEALKEPKALSEMLAELGAAFPSLWGPLIAERDAYLASRLAEVAPAGGTVVAVIGAAHVPGVIANLEVPLSPEQRAASLDVVPPPSRRKAALAWLIPALVALAAIHGLRHGGPAGLLAVGWAWLLPTGLGAALATALAGGGPAALGAALFAAPVAALYPPVGAGRVVGMIEARRPATAADLGRLSADLGSLGGIRRNPASRALLVAVASGLGARLGALIALGWMLLAG